MALALGVFGPGWIEVRHDLSEAAIASRLQDGVDALSQYCDKDKIQVLRFP